MRIGHFVKEAVDVCKRDFPALGRLSILVLALDLVGQDAIRERP